MPKVKRHDSSPRFHFRWRNFRGFDDTGWIDVRPITILIGANNSGKTSLVRPLLLMKQTMESRDARIALKTSGPLADVGRFKDFVFAHDLNREVVFSLRLRGSASSNPPRRLKPPLRYPPEEVRIHFVSDSSPSGIKLNCLSFLDGYDRVLLVRQLHRDGHYSLKFPGKLKGVFRKIAAESRPAHFLFSGNDLLDGVIRERAQRGKGHPVELAFSGSEADYLRALSYVSSHISNLMAHLSYIGPLREHPRRFYEGKEEVPATVGLRGEHAPEVLFLNKDSGFRDRVNHWLKHLGIARRIWPDRLRDNLFALKVVGRETKATVNFADTGFGLSQVLPLVVQAFHSPEKSIMFLEQPEIHLNPSLQSHLANLVAAIAESKRTVIVETHSEHLVLRLRALIAEEKVKPEDVALYYIERQRNRSVVRQIQIQRHGHIENEQWPKGFFEESLNEALRLARPQ